MAFGMATTGPAQALALSPAQAVERLQYSVPRFKEAKHVEPCAVWRRLF